MVRRVRGDKSPLPSVATYKDPNQQFINCTLFKIFGFLTILFPTILSANSPLLKWISLSHLNPPFSQPEPFTSLT